MAITAVQLDPGNAVYRVNAANVLMQMDRGEDAVSELREALRLAKSPEETAMVQNFLTQAELYTTMREPQRRNKIGNWKNQKPPQRRTPRPKGRATSTLKRPRKSFRRDRIAF